MKVKATYALVRTAVSVSRGQLPVVNNSTTTGSITMSFHELKSP